eukprot:EG_transcript_66498
MMDEEQWNAFHEKIETVNAALEVLKHAGDARYRDHPMEALQKLKEAEEALYTSGNDNRSRPRRDLNPFPGVESKVKEFMKPTLMTPTKPPATPPAPDSP